MNEFKTYHPIVNFLYFAFVIGFSMFFLNPVCLALSFLSSVVYLGMIEGMEKLAKKMMYIFPIVVVTAVINPLFNHEGATVLEYFPNGNPLTLESILRGIAAAVMLSNVILWFSCFNKVITGDKFIYLFGRFSPSVSLILSMALGFVPRFCEHVKKLSSSRRAAGFDSGEDDLKKRFKNAIKILSAMITWSFENSLETADSMKGRGWGIGKRTSFSNYVFDGRDLISVLIVLILAVYIIVASQLGTFDFLYFPTVNYAEITPYSLSALVVYLLLCVFPIIIEIKEDLRWKKSKSKI